jgi:hypothetical protein
MRFIPCLFLALALSTQIAAQQPASLDSKVSAILARMNGSDQHKRQAAFSDMMGLMREGQNRTMESGYSETLARFFKQHPEQAERIRLGLIHLLAEENHLFIEAKNPPPDSHEEDDVSEHYAELIDVVSSLHDERAMPALTGAITTGGMAQRGLLEYGDKALVPVVEKLKSPDALVRASALGMAIALLQKHDDAASLTRIRELLRSSLGDSGSVVRRKAVWEIDCLDDRQDFVPLLQEIAKTDPLVLPADGPADDGGDGDKFYPVRFDARRVLRHIQNNQPCGP